MKRIITLTAATLMAGSLFAAPSLAQINLDAGAGANVGVDAQVNTDKLGKSGVTTNTNLDTDSTAAIGGSFDGLMAAMNDTSASASVVGMLTVGTVNVIRVNEMANDNVEAFAKAKADHEASIDKLQSSIEGNAKVKAALEQKGVDPTSVVAANVEADGALTVYVE